MTEKNNLVLWPAALIKELLKSILLFPARYYTLGLATAAGWARREILWYEKFFGVRLFWHTLFTPLYGDYTRSGRLIGFFIRFFLLIFKIFSWLLATVLVFSAFIFYGVLPVLLVYLFFKIR